MPSRATNEVSIVEIGAALLRNWRFLVALPLLCALLGGVWGLTRNRSYVATASVLPQRDGGGAPSGAIALAQQFGLSIGGGASAHSPQYYADLLTTRSVLRRVVEAEYEAPDADGTMRRQNLIARYGLDPAADGAVPAWVEAVMMLRERVETTVRLETGLLEVRMLAGSPQLAEQALETLLRALNDLNTEVLQRRAEEESRFVAERVREAQLQLDSAEAALQSFLTENRAFDNSPHLRFEHDRLQRQVIMRQEVYTSMLRAEEQAKIDVMRDLPMFTVIDTPAGSALPRGRGVVIRTILGAFLGFGIACVLILLSELTRRGRKNQDPAFDELATAARSALADIRRLLPRSRPDSV